MMWGSLIVILAISSASSYRRHRDFHDSEDNEHLIHPPWFGPNNDFGSPGPPERERGFRPPNSGWHPWGKPITDRPHVTYPIYDKPTMSKPGPDNQYVEYCVASCPKVGGFNPVCGTNGVTYDNIEKLQCVKTCGVDVDLSKKTSCEASAGINIEDVIASCITTCSVTTEYNPVCGTDGITYTNPGRLECSRNCGRDVEIRRMSSCSVPPGPDNPDIITEHPPHNNGGVNNNGGGNNNGNENNNGSGINNDNGNNTGGGHNNGGENNDQGANNNGGKDGKGCNCNEKETRINPSMADVIECMQQCPMTPEVNPVCGTDGVTYSNPGKMLCLQFCGVDVKVKKFSTCSGEPLPTQKPVCPVPLDVPPTTEECIRRCPVTQEFKPVCGSDSVTYINLGSLQCKMRCGVDVSVQKLSACGEPSTNKPTAPTPPVWTNTDRPTGPSVTVPVPTQDNSTQICIEQCPPTLAYKPVCGTNGETYGSLARLQCVKRCGINVDVKSEGACDTSQSFTIPPDVLASIFPEDFTATTPKDSEEGYDLDQRFGDKQ